MSVINEEITETKSVSKPKGESEKMDKGNIISAIKNMTILEIAELVKSLEEEFGVSAAVPVASVASATASVEAVVAEQTEFTCVLTNIGEKKIQVIKEIRVITGLGLKEAKDLVDTAPKPIKEKVSKTEAEEIKKKLEEAGATVEIK